MLSLYYLIFAKNTMLLINIKINLMIERSNKLIIIDTNHSSIRIMHNSNINHSNSIDNTNHSNSIDNTSHSNSIDNTSHSNSNSKIINLIKDFISHTKIFQDQIKSE